MADQIPESFNDIIYRLQRGSAKLDRDYQRDGSLVSKQKPKILVVGCSDSRIPTDTLLDAKPGEVFTGRNIGNSLNDPDHYNELSAQAVEVLTYANHIGVETLIILPHGNCGCIANACKCAVAPPLSASASLEEKILRKMGDDKKFAIDAVNKVGAQAYLASHGLPEAQDEKAALTRAVEIEHSLHQAALARKHLAALGSNMKVIVAHFDLETRDVQMSIDDKGVFQKVTNNTPSPAQGTNPKQPPCCLEK